MKAEGIQFFFQFSLSVYTRKENSITSIFHNNDLGKVYGLIGMIGWNKLRKPKALISALISVLRLFFYNTEIYRCNFLTASINRIYILNCGRYKSCLRKACSVTYNKELLLLKWHNFSEICCKNIKFLHWKILCDRSEIFGCYIWDNCKAISL